jgi:hypothetical protein
MPFPRYQALFLFLGLSFLAAAACARQPGAAVPPGPVYRFSFQIHAADSLVQLPHEFLLGGSEFVALDSVRLAPGADYLLDARHGILRFTPALRAALRSDTARVRRLSGTYRALPLSFQPEYRRRSPVLLADSGAARGAPARGSRIAAPFSFDDVFGSKLQKSGSIVRGFSLGSNRDLSLNSGFRMQMSGRLTDDLELTAALTDENSPIQPEGTTQTLQEFDKVFVELRGSSVNATFGDFVLDVQSGEFSRFSRKLQGAKGGAQFHSEGGRGELLLAGAVARGKYATNQFRGLDGVQGPYRLSGKDNEREIVVIAGSERVFLNGEQMARGENQDYVIDYANAEVTFTPKRLVSHSSRIAVDFEYSDRRFNRTLVGGQAAAGLFGDKVTVRAGFFRESDDKDAPIDNTLTEADLDTLRAAGDDRSKASREGAVLVGPGKGQYLVRDTLVSGAGGGAALVVPVFVYAPFDTLNAVYSVSFSFVGAGKGDYEKVSVGNYRFAGVGRGSYAPLRFLPLAESHALVDIGIAGRVSGDLTLTGEFAGSALDRNLFSALDDGNNNGSAVNVGVRYAPERFSLGGANLGAVDLRLRERHVGARFAPLDRVDDVDFARTWNIADSANADETIREGSLVYLPVAEVTLRGGLGRIERAGLFSSKKYDASAAVVRPGGVSAAYQWELVDSRDPVRDNAGLWIRHGGKASQRFGRLTPVVEYRGEVLRSRDAGADTLEQASFQFGEIVPGIAVDSIGPMSVRAGVGVRWDDSLAHGSLTRVSVTTTQSYGWKIDEWHDLSSSIDVAVQRRSFTAAFRPRNAEDRENVLLRWQSRYAPFARGLEGDVFYEASSEQAAKQERVFQRVQRGTGSYVYAGDLNHNNTVDEQDFRLARFDGDFVAVSVPTDALTPVVDVKASTRVRVTPSRMLGTTGGWVAAALSAVTTETYARVEERSTEQETRRIYFLHLSRFLNDATTLAGSNLLTQDFNLFENRREGSLRFRYSQRRGLSQFATLAERAYFRERSARLRWQFLGEIANQIDFVEKTDNLVASAPSVRERTVRSTMLSSDWSYRPIQAVEAGFRIDAGRASNADTTEADINALAVRTIYSIEGRGQLRAELTREEVVLKRQSEIVPFELTGGRVNGKTWLWRIGLEYRVTLFIQAFVSYDGRSEGGGSPVHTARAEVRAFF